MTAVESYAARIDAVLEQRTRVRGAQPPGDLFAELPPDHPLLRSDARRELDPNLAVIASYLQPDDVVVDAGGGAGRVTLPLALRCREVIVVDPSAAMGAGFRANAERAGISNARFEHGDWLAVVPPRGSFGLANHVTYFVREIVSFLERLEAAGRRRVLITLGALPPPTLNARLFPLLFDEPEQLAPGAAELLAVLWELGIEPEVRVLREEAMVIPAAPDRESAIAGAIQRLGVDQWALWPLSPNLAARARALFEQRFDEFFQAGPRGIEARWLNRGPELLITWESGRRR